MEKPSSRELAKNEASVSGPVASATQQKPSPFIWSALWHMGTNMWSDIPVKVWGNCEGEEQLKLACQADYLRFDESVWGALTARMQAVGMNMVMIDLGEALQYESHPELAVKGSWTIERFRKELTRLRAMGLEPIPKLNFSTGHDTWLKEYEHQVSTPIYYKVCADLIHEVCDIFDHPRFFHLGYDEETAENQAQYSMAIVRQGELWWHDFFFFVKQVEAHGVRPWIFADYHWSHPDDFLRRVPRSVLLSNWYYYRNFDPETRDPVKTYLELDKAGFEQVPCGSTWSSEESFSLLVAFNRKHLAPARLKGFLMATWLFTLPQFQEKNLRGIELVEDEIQGFQRLHGIQSRN